MKSLLLIEDNSRNCYPTLSEIFSSSEFQCDCLFFGNQDPKKNKRTPLETIIENIKSGAYDAFVLGSTPVLWNPRKSAVRNAARFFARWPEINCIYQFERIFSSIKVHGRKTPLYVIDVMDCPVIDNAKFRFLAKCSAYFKRELPSNLINSFLYVSDKTESPDNIMRNEFFASAIGKLRPISMGIADDMFTWASRLQPEKKIDVFFAGNFANRPTRKLGQDALLKLKDDGFRVHISEEIYPKDVFYEFCAQSLICWSPDGFGSDCFRHYEIGACGSVALRKHSSLFQYAPFRENVECLYYLHEGADIYAVTKKALSNPDHLRVMGKQAQRLVADFHRHSRLANYVLSC